MFAADFRARAREALRGRWDAMMAVMLAAQAVMLSFFLNTVYQLYFSEVRIFYIKELGLVRPYYYPTSAVSVVLLLVMLGMYLVRSVVQAGKYRASCALLRGEAISVRQLFPMHMVWKLLLMNLLRAILIAAQWLLLVVPGVIAAYRYQMADYLIMQNPELGPVEALRESRVQMKGYKGRLFCLDLSFFGWLLATGLAEYIALTVLPAGALGTWIYTLLSWVMSAALQAYMLTAETAFFDWRMRGGYATQDAQEESDSAEEQAAYDAAPLEHPERVYTDMSANEAVARDVYMDYACSLNRMRAEGVLAQYEEMHISPVVEARWRREYAQKLMLRFDGDPSALDELLTLSAEYAMEDLTSRALERIERHIRQESLPPEEILNMCGRMLAMISSGAFAENEGFVQRRREQIADMVDRLERRLEDTEGDGDWKHTIEKIRAM